METFFGKNFTLENVESTQKFKFRAAQMVKMAVFGASKWPKLNSSKVGVAENPEFSTLCVPN